MKDASEDGVHMQDEFSRGPTDCSLFSFTIFCLYEITHTPFTC